MTLSMVPPGAAMAARGVLSELHLNLDLNIGPLPHPVPLHPASPETRSHVFPTHFYRSCCISALRPPRRDVEDNKDVDYFHLLKFSEIALLKQTIKTRCFMKRVNVFRHFISTCWISLSVLVWMEAAVVGFIPPSCGFDWKLEPIY